MPRVGDPTTWRAAVLAAGLTVFLLVLEYQIFGTPYRHYPSTAFESGALDGVLRLGALLAAVGVQSLFFWTGFVASWPARATCVALFAVVIFIQYAADDGRLPFARPPLRTDTSFLSWTSRSAAIT